ILIAVCALGICAAGCGGSRQAATTSAAPPASKSNGSSRFAAVQHPAAGRFKPDGATLASCAPTRFQCYEQALGNLAYRSGPKTALDLVTKLLAEGRPAVRGDCHTITHLIGSATLARFHGNAAEAMGDGSMICGSGYYHGLIEYTLI